MAELVRAALESVCYQSVDLLDAMAADGLPRPPVVRVDGGMAANTWMLGFLADILGVAVERPAETETTARGAAILAALSLGLISSLTDASWAWQGEARFEPTLSSAERAPLVAGWRKAVSRVRETA